MWLCGCIYIIGEDFTDSGVIMKKKEKIKLGIAYILVFLITFYVDMSEGNLEDGSVIYRDGVGGESIDVELLLDVEDVLTDYELSLEVEPRQITEEEAKDYFARVIKEIDTDFKEIKKVVPIKESYMDGIVEAEWDFLPIGVIGVDGVIQMEEIPEEGLVVTANVTLNCGVYEKIYTFPLRLEEPELTQQEKIEKELSEWIEKQQLIEGKDIFELPKELGGLSTKWHEKKEFLSLKVLFLEGISVVLLFFARKKEQENTKKKQCQRRELQYPEIVNQLLILMEAGMTTRQAWHRIAHQYKEKQKKKLVEDSEVYEMIVQMDRRLSEGEKERAAYEDFGNQMNIMCYRRLMRLLINNLEKGNRDICQQLSVEAKQAYDRRLLLAKKQGEEASTNMLVPMMLMMVLVMVIVMAPAIMSFSM